MNTTSLLPKIRIFGVLLLFVLLGFLVGSCSKGPNDTEPGTTETTTVYGRITDEAGLPLAGVNVSTGTQSDITRANGIFMIKNASVPKGRAVILCKKAGYFNGARAEMPRTDGTTRMTLSMMSNATTANVSASSGGTVSAGGASVKFEPGSFTDASGKAYTGSVSVAARYLNPAKSDFYNFFSGDEQAQRLDGSTTNLVSCGVLRVELQGSGGIALKLDPSKPATLTCPKPTNDPKAPKDIQLWSFDETLGEWKEEGTATLQGSNYVGTVTHFTDYNFDYCNEPNGTLQFRIVCNGAPIGGVTADVLGRKVTTGEDGIIHIRRVLADGRPVAISILASDNGGVYFMNIPFPVVTIPDQLVDAGDISMDSPCPATLEGTIIGCEDGPTEALVTVVIGTDLRYIYARNGHFALQVPSATPLVVNVMDAAGNVAPRVDVAPLVSGELRKISAIKVCGSKTDNFIDLSDPSLGEGNSIGLSPDGSKIAVMSMKGSTNILIFATATGNKLMEITLGGTRYYNMTLQFSTDNNRLLVGSSYDATLVYDVSGATGTLLTSFPSLSWSALSDDGTQVIGLSNKVIGVYSATTGSLIKSLTAAAIADSASGIGFDRSENAVVFSQGFGTNKFSVWGIGTDAELRSITTTSSNNYNHGFSEDGERLGVSSDYKNWEIYNTTTGMKMLDFVTDGSQSGTNGIPIYLTKNLIFSTESITGGRVIKYSNLSDGLAVGVKLVFGTSYISSVAASRNENYLAASFNGGVRLWKLK